MWRRAILPGLGWFLSAPPAHAGMCALCREALSKGGSPGLIRGFYWSILVIGSVPLLVLTLLGLVIWRGLKQR